MLVMGVIHLSVVLRFFSAVLCVFNPQGAASGNTLNNKPRDCPHSLPPTYADLARFRQIEA